MKRAPMILLSVGVALFIALLAWQGFDAVGATLMAAGWGLVVVAVFHVIPLALDAGAIAVMFDRQRAGGTLRDALLARWVGESANSLLPAGQLGGPVLMVRHLVQRGMRIRDAAAAVTVSTTVQAVAQYVFAFVGLALFAVYAAHDSLGNLWLATGGVTVLLAICIVVFYVAQRRGMFGWLLRALAKLFGKPEWAELATRADAVDDAVRESYRDRRKVVATFLLSLGGWVVGTGEVWLALHFLGHPVGWLEALLLESVGQAIRGAAFAIPGSLGAQEGGYLLLATVVGLPPEAGLALSLAKRAREVGLGVPGLMYLHWSERSNRRRRAISAPVTD